MKKMIFASSFLMSLIFCPPVMAADSVLKFQNNMGHAGALLALDYADKKTKNKPKIRKKIRQAAGVGVLTIIFAAIAQELR